MKLADQRLALARVGQASAVLVLFIPTSGPSMSASTPRRRKSPITSTEDLKSQAKPTSPITTGEKEVHRQDGRHWKNAEIETRHLEPQVCTHRYRRPYLPLMFGRRSANPRWRRPS